MKFIDYLKDKYKEIILSILSFLLVIMILLIFDVNIKLVFFISLILISDMFIVLIYNFMKRKNFYNDIKMTLNKLDKKYLITEMFKEPNFIEGEIFKDYLYEINKSMIENINKYKYTTEEFIEYIEMWCHEIKTPLATLYLLFENNKSKINDSIKEEVDKIDNLIEQVLYFARSGNVEKDYIIKEVNLKDVVDSVIKKNKKDLIGKKIKIKIGNLNIVNTDSKWLIFILNQIITNSIKYISKNPIIEIYSKELKNSVVLYIKDNGIGIPSSEITRVFDKFFTGSNGRKYKSTGIGLYLSKKLCEKLGHGINIESKINEYTIVSITFPKNSMTNDVYKNC